MIWEKRRIIRQICAFLLAFAMVCNFSSAAVIDAANFLEETAESAAEETTSQAASSDAEESAQENTKSASSGVNAPIMTLADGETKGIDLYTVNGSYLTLLGNGLYSTEKDAELPYGSLEYDLKMTGELNMATTLNVAEGVTVQATLLAVNSTHLTLTLADNAHLTLVVSDVCGVGDIILGNGATLTVITDTADDASDALSFIGAVGGENSSLSASAIALSLVGDISAGTISFTDVTLTGTADSDVKAVNSMTLNNAVMNAGESALHEISSLGSLSILGSGAAIKTVSLGIAAGGEGEVSLAGIGTLTVSNLGALADDAKAYPVKVEMQIDSAAVHTWDYTITYKNYGALGYEDLGPGANDPVSYRVQREGINESIIGYHTDSGYHAFGDLALSTVPLTVNASRTNYEFRVWSLTPMADDADSADDKTNDDWMAYDGKEWDEQASRIVDAASPVYGYSEAIITSGSGNVVLYAVYVPESVVVQLHTNTGDASERVFAVFPAYVGAKGISLFPYLESDDLNIQGQNAETFADAPDGGNFVSIANYQVAARDADGIIDLYAIWSADLILVTYKIPEFYPGYTYQYKDANGEWQTIPATTLEELNTKLTELVGTLDIYYGKKYGELPLLRCVKTDGDGMEYEFVGWYIESASGDKIMLDAETVVSASTTTANALANGAQVIFAFFENARYTLTVPSALGKWQFYDELGNAIIFTDNGNNTMSAYVNSDRVITMTRQDETTVSSYWRLTNLTTGSLIWPAEVPSSNGGSYWLSYTFTMPKASVSAVYDETVRWDTAMGDYTFGTFEINGRSSYGIRITDRSTGVVLHEFRWIMTNSATKAYFTSSVETDHQIKLDAATTLYLDGVKLAARGDIVNELSAFYDSGVYTGTLAEYAFAKNQNIFIDNNPAVAQSYNSSTTYTVTIELLANSKVFAIGQKAWINNITNNWSPDYRSQVVINGRSNTLEMYSLLVHSVGSSVNECNLNVLRTGNDAIDEKVHWLHFDAGEGTISGCTVDANGRSLYTRHGGSLSGSGNGTSFSVSGGSVLRNVDTFHAPFLSLSGVEVHADRILTIGYGFRFVNSTIVADIIGYSGPVHTGYSNSDSYLENCNVTINDWMSVSRMRIRNGTTLTVQNGFHLYESLSIFGGSTVTVGSLEKFKTTVGNSEQDGKHYSSTDANHFFYVDIYGGATLNVKGDMNIGINHDSMPEIKVYGVGTTVNIDGSADIINTMRIYDGASMTVGGNLTLHQDLEVQGSGTNLSVASNLYHVTTGANDSAYKKVSYSDGTSEEIYWGFSFADESSVVVSGVIGSKTEYDRTHIDYSRINNMDFASNTIIRDVQIVYVLPDGFTNNVNNPANIRLKGDVYVGSDIAFLSPDNTGGSPIVLEQNCWYNGDTLWTDLTQNQQIELYDGVLRLEARATAYLLSLTYDGGAIVKFEYLAKDDTEWMQANLKAEVNIPIDAEVRITVPANYASLVCAESLTGGVYTPISLMKTQNGSNYEITFTMSSLQIMLRVTERLTLYLDEGNIHVKAVNGEIGFARYSGMGFVPYGGHLTVTQKDTAVSCLNTLYIERNVAESEASLTMTGIVIKNDDSSAIADTVYFAPGVTATLHLSGNNSIRNIRVPQTASATLVGDATAHTQLMNSPYFSGVYSETDTTRYYAQIGDNYSGHITMRGGKYTTYGYFKHQGSAVSIGNPTSGSVKPMITLDGITFISASASLNPRCFATPGGTINVTDCTLDMKTTSAAPFNCHTLRIGGDSKVTFNYNTGNDYAVSAFSGVSNVVELSGTTVVEDFYLNLSNTFMSNTPFQSLTLSDNAAYMCHGGLVLNSLTVQDNASIHATGATALTITASQVNVLGGEVVCGYLILSGYVNDQASGADLVTSYTQNSNIVSSGALTVSGGTVTANGGTVTVVTENDTTGTVHTLGGIIGGSRNALIQISGGTVNASHIGESDYAFGVYRRGTYMLADANSTAATIDITNGDLRFDLLGGELAVVTLSAFANVTMRENAKLEGSAIKLSDHVVLNMSGGAVIGGEGAVITLDGNGTIAGANGGLGKIEAPNGMLTITELASAHVSIVNLPNGDVTVSTTSKAYESKYSYNTGEDMYAGVGLFADYGGIDEPSSADPIGSHAGDLTAENITVKSGSYVSAYRLGSNAAMPNSGLLMLEAASYIYTCVYGAFSNGSITVDKVSGSVVNGKIQVSINYDLNLGNSTENIEDIMPADALYNYEPTSEADKQELLLPIPERKGYRFDGWWYQGTANMTEEYKQTYVFSSRTTSTNLIAQWTPVNIWLNMTDPATGLNEWKVITYEDDTYVLPSYIVNGNSSNAYTAQDVWQTVFGSAFLLSDVERAVPAGLYELYLSQNGVNYSDGLTEKEIETIRILESLINEEDAAAQSAIKFVSLKPDWTAVQHRVIFNAVYTDVESFRYGDVVKPITNSGTGRQEVAYYIGATYALGAYVGGERMPGLPIPIRKGYNFIKWVNDSVEIPYNDTEMIVDQSVSSFTAVYEPQKFRIYLNPVKDTVTGEFAQFDTSALDSEVINGLTVYYFETKFGDRVGANLPDTEILGYVHEGWEIVLKDGSVVPVDSDTIIKWDGTDVVLPSGYTVPDGIDGVLVLTPDAKKTEITYEMHGGSWTSLVTPELKEIFSHYTNQSTESLPTVSYTKMGDVYTIANKDDVKTNSVTYRGYRFLGWATDAEYSAWQNSSVAIEEYFTEDKLITMSDVTFYDVTYHAIWKPCEYNTVLHAWNTDADKKTWSEYFSNGASVTITYSGSSNATVLTQGTAVDLPDMTEGELAYKPAGNGETTTRLLLGWMFDGVANPVTDYYQKDGSANQNYARLVAMAMNNDSLFQDGDIFLLPEIVEDPGDGGTIHLYAVYRERSLIFVHRTPDGEETVKLIADYDISRSGYPDASTLLTAEDEAKIPAGFELSGWYVNSVTPDVFRDYTWYGLEYTAHPRYNYYASHNETYVYRTDGASSFSVKYYQDKDPGYDIYIYSYYAPQIEEDFTVYAQAGKNPISADDSYTVPDSMRVNVSSGYPILYSVEMSGFVDQDIQLVDKSVFDDWTGEDTWVSNGKTYHANKTFALEMIVTTAQSTWNVPLTLCTSKGNDAYITAGSKIQILVYSTNRLANTQSLGDVIVTIQFPTLAHAELKLNVELNRRAAIYELVLDAKTPDYEDFNNISGWGVADNSQGGKLMKRDFEFGSQSSLLPALLLEGYTFVGWQTSNGADVATTLNYAPAKGENTYLAETLTALWKIGSYELSPNNQVHEHKNFVFKNQNGDDITNTIVADGNGVYRVPYKTQVILSTKAGHEINGYPEFIKGIDLDQNESFFMPAKNVALMYNRLITISILHDVVIDDETYQIGNAAPVTWRGDYSFSGSFKNVTIRTTNDLGTRNIRHAFAMNGMNSGVVQIDNGGEKLEVRVFGTNSIEKIDAGVSELVLMGGNTAQLELSPVNNAAINGGTVRVQTISVKVNLTGAKHPSGNVATTAVAGEELILMSSAKLNAVCGSPAATYVGTVLDCETVRVTSGAVLTAAAESGCPVSANARLIDDTTTTIAVHDAQISSEMQMKSATATLTLNNGSTVTMSGGNANVTVNSITVSGDTENNKSDLIAYDAVIKGDQTIGVYANVLDRYGRHLDIKSGEIVVTNTGYTQSTRTVSENRSYVLVGSANTTKVALKSPQNTIYLDNASVGDIACEGSVNIRLLSNSTIAALDGASAAVEIANVISDEMPELTASGRVVAHTLSIRDCKINAQNGGVGSMGEMVSGKVGKVTLNGCHINAGTVGALGEIEESFTLVERLNSPIIEGTLVIDHYRLDYEIDASYDTTELPKVLRSTIVDGTEIYFSTIPAAPTVVNGATSYFLFWYLMDLKQDLHILSVGDLSDDVFQDFDVINALDRVQVAWATDTGDETKTLHVYAWMKPRFSGTIISERQLNMISSDETTVSVYTNGAWTAKFTVDGTILENSEYQLMLGQAFPAGTMLTLMNMTGSVPKYYYYECLGNEMTIALSSFKAMGGSEPPMLLTGGMGAVVSDVLQLSADFGGVLGVSPREKVDVSLGIISGTAELGKADSLFYSLTTAPTANVEVTDSRIIVSWTADAQSTDVIYLTAEISSSLQMPLPYDATVMLDDVKGTRIGDDMWLFALGNANAAQSSKEYSWRIDGFESDTYTIKWCLSSAKANASNVLADILDDGQYAHTVLVTEPYMSVVLDEINGVFVSSRVLDLGKEYKLVFTVDTLDENISYYVSAEKQTVWGNFTAVNGNAIVYDATTSTLTISDNLAAGVYRICFSLDETNTQDNVYFTFIVE